jgi:hypothetical protein
LLSELIPPTNVAGIGLGQIFRNGADLTVGRERIVEVAALSLNISFAQLRPKGPFVIACPGRRNHPAIGHLRHIKLTGLLLKPAVPKHTLDVRRVQPGRLRVKLPRPRRIGDGGDRRQVPIGRSRVLDIRGSLRLVLRNGVQWLLGFGDLAGLDTISISE